MSSMQPALLEVFSPGARILFQGDSITDGGRGRNASPHHDLGHGYQSIISSRYGALYPERGLTFLNRGISGDTVAGVLGRRRQDIFALQPDVLSILIGVNDLNFGVTSEEYTRDYDTLLAEVRRELPEVKLILGEPFGLPAGEILACWDSYRAALVERQKIVADLGERYNAVVVRYQAMFEGAMEKAPPEYWIWDGIHPLDWGHYLMAEEWIRTVATYWKT